MRRIFNIATMAAVLAMPAAAQTSAPSSPTANGWGSARWGASLQDVQKAIPTARPVSPDRQASACGEGDGRALLEIPHHRDFGRVWETTLCFAGPGNGGLRAVNLWRETDQDFRVVARDLVARYGQPSEYIPGRLVPGERMGWTSGGTAITFVHMVSHSGILVYKAAQPR